MKITKRQLKRIIKEEKTRLLNEVTAGERADALRLAAEDMAADAANAGRLARQADRTQLTLNQPEVDVIAQMADQVDKMYFPFTKIRSIPQSWLDNGDYEKLEQTLLDLSSDLDDLASDMKKEGI